MECRICKHKMEDTKGTSFGTGQPIFQCKKCGWTAVFNGKNLEEATREDFAEVTAPEDIFYSGIKYKDYKCVIEIVGADGEQKVEFITWRADIIAGILKEASAIRVFEPGDIFTIKAAPHVDIGDM